VNRPLIRGGPSPPWKGSSSKRASSDPCDVEWCALFLFHKLLTSLRRRRGTRGDIFCVSDTVDVPSRAPGALALEGATALPTIAAVNGSILHGAIVAARMVACFVILVPWHDIVAVSWNYKLLCVYLYCRKSIDLCAWYLCLLFQKLLARSSVVIGWKLCAILFLISLPGGLCAGSEDDPSASVAATAVATAVVAATAAAAAATANDFDAEFGDPELLLAAMVGGSNSAPQQLLLSLVCYLKVPPCSFSLQIQSFHQHVCRCRWLNKVMPQLGNASTI